MILARMDADPISYDGTHCNLTCIPVAEDRGERRMGIWLSSERFLSDLEPPASLGATAAQRAIAMLGAKPMSTQKASVVFGPRTGSEVVSEIYGLSQLEEAMQFPSPRIFMSIGIPYGRRMESTSIFRVIAGAA